MNNKKSLAWGLAGLAVVILAGIYLYSRDQERRLAEAVPENQISIAQEQTDQSGQQTDQSQPQTATLETAKPAVDSATQPDAAEEMTPAKANSEATVADSASGDNSEPMAGPSTTMENVSSDQVKLEEQNPVVADAGDATASAGAAEKPSDDTASGTPAEIPSSNVATQATDTETADDTITPPATGGATETAKTPASVPPAKGGEEEELTTAAGSEDSQDLPMADETDVSEQVAGRDESGDAAPQVSTEAPASTDTPVPPRNAGETASASSDSKPEAAAAPGSDDKMASGEDAGKPLAPDADDKPAGQIETAALDPKVASQDTPGVATKRMETAAESTGEQPAPRFDLLRVEPDGSTVVAGRAQPGTTVEVVAGDSVLTEAPVGRSGDFAAVLDEPLDPGDYQITLREVRSGDVVSESEEVATVSVPDEDPDKLLVMVTKPGEASRLLSQPEAQEPPVPSEVPREDDVADQSETPSSSAQREVAAASEPGRDETASEPMSTEPEQPADTMIETGAEQEKEPKVKVAAVDPKQADTDMSDTSGVESGDMSTAAPAETSTPKPAKPDLAEARLRIDAVEIEGDRLFVAGSAAPVGARVRVYANGDTVGDSPVSTSQRFLVEADHSLSVGQHTISADLLMHGSDATSMRVAVPFTRPAGRQVAAVAVPDDVPEKVDETPKPTRQNAVVSDDTAESEVSETRPPARPETQASETQATEAPSDNTVQSGGMAENTLKDEPAGETQPAEQAEAKPEPKPVVVRKNNESMNRDKPVVESKPMEQSASIDTTQVKPESGSDEQSRLASAPVEKPASEDRDFEPRTVVQPALEPRDGSVIIRRGDTLWQISRRVYGRGVRYTTIYLANTDQIANPDFIEPGQVFKVPEDPLDNSEDIHRKRIRKR